MHALLLTALLVAGAGRSAEHRLRLQPNLPRGGSATYTFCDAALTAGNRTGNWGCVNGDGTAPTGDNLGPWVASGSPTSTTGTTCSSPSYKTLNGATPDYFTSTVALTSVSSAFSWCALYQGTSSLQSGFFWGVYPCCSSYAMTVEAAPLTQYSTGGVSVSSGVVVGSEKTLICGSFNGTSTQTIYLKNGSTSGFNSGTGTPVAGASYKVTFGSDSPYSVTGKFYGGFITFKALTLSDFNAIYDAVAGSGCT